MQDKELEKSKFDQRFIAGVWLGRTTTSDEHIVATGSGVFKTRTVRARNDTEQWDNHLLAEVKGLPWATKNTSQVGTEKEKVQFPEYQAAKGPTGLHSRGK